MSSPRDDTLAYFGHQVHVMRRREVATLLGWAGDLTGRTLLDVAGGDGYWAGQAIRRGARAVCLDLARDKLEFGRRLRGHPGSSRVTRCGSPSPRRPSTSSCRSAPSSTSTTEPPRSTRRLGCCARVVTW